MKICRIIDESRDSLLIGYLLYFEHGKAFSVELSDGLSAADVPLFFEHFVEKGRLTVDPYWSERWVNSRIVPTDRQNLGMILRDNGLKEYDPFRLLMLSDGRCAQDDCAVFRTDLSQAPEWLLDRRSKKLDHTETFDDGTILSVFRDGTIWKTDPVEEGLADERLSYVLKTPELRVGMEMISGGLGVRWQKDMMLTAEQLYGRGIKLPIDRSQFDRLVKYYVMTTSEVCDSMNCSRQYVDKKVKDGSLGAIKDSGGTRLYTASDVARSRE